MYRLRPTDEWLLFVVAKYLQCLLIIPLGCFLLDSRKAPARMRLLAFMVCVGLLLSGCQTAADRRLLLPDHEAGGRCVCDTAVGGVFGLTIAHNSLLSAPGPTFSAGYHIQALHPWGIKRVVLATKYPPTSLPVSLTHQLSISSLSLPARRFLRPTSTMPRVTIIYPNQTNCYGYSSYPPQTLVPFTPPYFVAHYTGYPNHGGQWNASPLSYLPAQHYGPAPALMSAPAARSHPASIAAATPNANGTNLTPEGWPQPPSHSPLASPSANCMDTAKSFFKSKSKSKSKKPLVLPSPAGPSPGPAPPPAPLPAPASTPRARARAQRGPLTHHPDLVRYIRRDYVYHHSGSPSWFPDCTPGSIEEYSSDDEGLDSGREVARWTRGVKTGKRCC
ncbi:hypothetical protein DFP72DRAFT_294908 [Ephemerocybe angulata]|uniref:Uncharacterized protein n=1 Tax=Ephemerocybe angulata TaxID=980116 RepID=A0A8H6HZM4_9AGAR|nr:hypothetical protein DFP72DRAFT_294908 [Tulosesus angulatus]